MKIGELSKKMGIPSSAIRYYESIGIAPKPYRSSGKRVYKTDSMLPLQVIKKAQELGFSLKEIKTLMSGFKRESKPKVWDKMAENKIIELQNQVNESQKMILLLKEGVKCDCLDLKSCKLLFNQK